MNDFHVILVWLQYNLNWLDTNWAAVVEAASKIIAGASVLAALLPDKRGSALIAKLDQHINTDNIHKVIDFLAVNIGNNVSKAKVNILVDNTPKTVSTPTTEAK